MTDHLEPFRRMVRSIRFVPPIWHNQPHYSLTERGYFTADREQAAPVSAPAELAAAETVIDPSERTLALIRAAVAQPTVFKPYVILENIGDRISRLAAPVQSPTVTNATTSHLTPLPVIESVTEAEAIESKIQSIEPERHPEPEEFQLEEPKLEDPEVKESSVAEEKLTAEPVFDWLGSVTDYLETVTHKLAEEALPKAQSSQTLCPQCGSDNIRKNGHRGIKQKYLCKDCRKQFTGFVEESVTLPRSKKADRKKAKGFGS